MDKRLTSKRSLASEAAFREGLANLGATLLEPEWLGHKTPHLVRCVNGHECRPWPSTIRAGGGICMTCVGHDPAVAEKAFRARLGELGATLLEPYRNSQVPHHVRCGAGHDCWPRPNGVVNQGRGICRTCGGNNPAVAEAAFRKRLAELGATMIEPRWLGIHKPHLVRCASGHDSKPTPSFVRDGGGVCRGCAGTDPEMAEAAFRKALARLGGEMLEPRWINARTPHKVRCPEGHIGYPTPDNVRHGDGICARCAGKEWDVFYVVSDPCAELVKFGITGRGGTRRLDTHRRAGFTETIRFLPDLPGDIAFFMEQAVRVALRSAGLKPVRGREYFDIGATAIILNAIDSYPGARMESARLSAAGSPAREPVLVPACLPLHWGQDSL